MAKKVNTAPRMPTDERRWRAESNLRTLAEADKIRNDPKAMSDVRKVAAEQQKALSKIAGKK